MQRKTDVHFIVTNAKRASHFAVFVNRCGDRFSSFAFRLSPFTFCLKYTFLLLPFTLLLSSCMINPDMQGKGQVYLQGEWQQNPDAVRKQLTTYTSYHFKFECDSFYISIHTNSKVNYGADSCMRGGQWTEYTRGTYQQRNDTLYLKGQYCNPDFSLKDVGGCFAAGNYKEAFKVISQKDSLLQLTNLADVIPMDVHLIKRTVCHQKPL